jgi:trk system potassium uptake protein TrkH
MRLSIVVHTTGMLVRLFGAMLLLPTAVAVWFREWNDCAGFAVTAAATMGVGVVMRRVGGRAAGAAADRSRRVEGLAIVAGTWLLLAIVAAIPYVWSGLGFVDALFESMSGLTATGATIITDVRGLGRAVFVWRTVTMWLGGLGVIALFIAVLPRLAIGGRELFFAEAPGPTDEKLTPQLRQTALALWKLYALLTVAMIVALVAVGMPLFDAVSNALSTIAAGGFSPHPQSIGGYQSPAVEWVVTLFMFVAGANFALQYRAVRGGHASVVRDEELRAYAGIIIAASVAVTVFLMQDGMGFADAVRHGLFQVVSILTTTGFASVDFQLWNDQAKMVLLLLMFIGGCAGSAAGGPKVVRHLLMARYTLRELKRTLHPRAVLPVKLGGRVVPESTLRDVQVFMLFYLLTFAVGAAIVVGFGADLMTGITATIACLSNVGPGFEAVGPMSTYAGLHPVSKIVLTLAMWIGRLEVLTVLVFFRVEPWRSMRWSAGA